MIDFEFDPEELEMVEETRRFAQNEVKPNAALLDRDPEGEGDAVFRELWKKAAEMGVVGAPVPEHHGGSGVSPFVCGLLAEELAAADAGFAASVGVNWVVQSVFITLGTSQQLDTYLPMISSADAGLAAICATEPSGGSDVESCLRAGPGTISSTYRKQDGGYLINGVKNFISNGGRSCLYLVMATEDVSRGGKAASRFIVPADTPGVSVGRIEDKMGFCSSWTAQMLFDDVFVPTENLIGDEHEAVLYSELMFSMTRGSIGAVAVGIARAAFEAALAYAKERVQGGRPIIEHQAVGFMLADMATMIEVARAVTQKATWMSVQFDRELEERLRMACVAKIFCSDMLQKVTSDAVQIFGGYGYMRDYPVEKYMRDAKVTQIFEGTNQINRWDILESIKSMDTI